MQVGKMEGKSDLRERIMFYENEFDLVLLAERFDESLVVMKDVLCWDTQDIKYLKVRFFFLDFSNISLKAVSEFLIDPTCFLPLKKSVSLKLKYLKVFFPKTSFSLRNRM